MSINLIKANTHDNCIALYKKRVDKNIFYIKESTSTEYNSYIEKEYNGYDWYYKNILNKNNIVKINKRTFNELIIPEFFGTKFFNEKKFHAQKKTMLNIINFYKNKWPINEEIVIHGDMGLSNFIFNKDEIMLIDWEHFHKNKVCYYGFDIINMLFISFHYKIKGSSKVEKYFLRKAYRILFENVNFENVLINNPFYESKRYIVEHYKNQKNYKSLIKNKFILATSSDHFLKNLDSFVTN